jgi:uncharacterized protein
MDLDTAEIRVLGCLLEKQRTTPDAYPLSLNALRLACNQATNREPVVDYDEATVRAALHRLGRRRWTRLASGAGSRAAKYRHLLDDALPLDRGEHAVMCVLMLRGPQTPGELKQRSERMHAFADLAALRATLDRLIDRGLVRRLDRRPGHKEERYVQLLGDPDAPEARAGRDGRPRGDGRPGGDTRAGGDGRPDWGGRPGGEGAPSGGGEIAAAGRGASENARIPDGRPAWAEAELPEPRQAPAPTAVRDASELAELAELTARVASQASEIAALSDLVGSQASEIAVLTDRVAALERDVGGLREALGG